MPDDYGPIYEGVIAAGASRIGIELLPTKRQTPNCRDVCAYAGDCIATNSDVKLDVDPDLVLRCGKNLAVAYVTHWRTADSFQKKFWRSMEELFQYRIYRPDIKHISWVFEPLQIKGGLLNLMKQVFDYSVDYNSSPSDSLTKFMKELPALAQSMGEISQESAKQYFLSPGSSAAARDARDDVSTRLRDAFSDIKPSRNDLWSIMIGNCFSARQKGWKSQNIQAKIRTPVQIGAVVLAAAKYWGVRANLATLLSSRSLRTCEKGFCDCLTTLPIRKKGDDYIYFCNGRIGGVTLNEKVLNTMDAVSAKSLASIAVEYHEVMEGDPVWGPYLRSIVNTRDLGDSIRRYLWKRPRAGIDVSGMTQCALSSRDESWMLELALCICGANLND